ncbi:MAG: MotA/TolQ/ExbB proton channel family protein [Rubrivivax sp.]|jgi:biopolymer transport protein ExbB
MEGLTHFLAQTDTVGRSVAVLLLLMSIGAWTLIVWKTLVLRRALGDLGRAIPAFWDAASLEDGRARLGGMDRERLLSTLVDAARQAPAGISLATQGAADSQRTRRLRDALQQGLGHLQFGQVALASIGSTSPFIGLFGTVWGIYHALVAIGTGGAFAIDKVAGPVGEALVMTAAGLAVAIPAVLAYNLFGKWIGLCEERLEGFAHDLRELMSDDPHPAALRRDA